MEVRVRERLIGALVLVAIVVLVVPAILKGRDPAPAAPTETAPTRQVEVPIGNATAIPEEQILVPEPARSDAAPAELPRRDTLPPQSQRQRQSLPAWRLSRPRRPHPHLHPYLQPRPPRRHRHGPSSSARFQTGRKRNSWLQNCAIAGMRRSCSSTGPGARCSTACAWGPSRIARAPKRSPPASRRTDSSRSSPGTPDRLECRTLRGGPRINGRR